MRLHEQLDEYLQSADLDGNGGQFYLHIPAHKILKIPVWYVPLLKYMMCFPRLLIYLLIFYAIYYVRLHYKAVSSKKEM